MVGIIQGRLLPKYKNRYQAHPLGYWQNEFSLASEIGLDCIEFILDYNDSDKNPLIYPGGIDEILSLSDKTSVMVKTLCADYFMEAPLHSSVNEISKKSLYILHNLLDVGEKLGITDIVIPCVDQSSLQDIYAVERFVNVINSLLDDLERKNINLSLETDLAPVPFADLLSQFDSEHIKVNYDIGNSASLGYCPIEELDAYGNKITDIHIKDRVLDGGSIMLGKGNANFDLFFTKLKEFNYKGPFIMQAFRDEEGVKIFKKQYKWIQQYLSRLD